LREGGGAFGSREIEPGTDRRIGGVTRSSTSTAVACRYDCFVQDSTTGVSDE
jgi:hypothetical protein